MEMYVEDIEEYFSERYNYETSRDELIRKHIYHNFTNNDLIKTYLEEITEWLQEDMDECGVYSQDLIEEIKTRAINEVLIEKWDGYLREERYFIYCDMAKIYQEMKILVEKYNNRKRKLEKIKSKI